MFSSAIVIFRETLEIALIIGVVLAATQGVPGRNRWVWLGLAGGVAGSLLVALFAGAISQAAEGLGQEYFNAGILLAASAMIGWTVIWMKTHARQITQKVRNLGGAVKDGEMPLYSLAVVVALASLREGSEMVLFTYGLIATGQALWSIGAGSMLGFAGGAAAGCLVYLGLIRVPVRYVFAVTGWLLILLAAGMASLAAKYLASAGMFASLSEQVWNSSALLSEESAAGQVMQALFGYSARPMAIQLLFYLAVLGVLGGFMFYTDRKTKKIAAAFLLAIGTAALSFPGAALATKKVSSPYVEKGELEVEWRGSYDFDDNKNVDGTHKHKYAVGYGFTDWWKAEIYGIVEKGGRAGEDFEFTDVELDSTFMLAEPGQYWVDTGLKLEYYHAMRGNRSDKVEAKLLLAKPVGQFVHMANFKLEKDIGENAADDLEGGFAWQTRYRVNPYFEPGFELHSSFGELQETKPYEQQSHLLGPIVQGKAGPVKYNVGYLFGVSRAAPEAEFKWILEYEMYF